MNNTDMNKTVVGTNLSRLMRLDPAINGNENELARATNVPQPTIHRILTGESGNPRRPTLEKLAAYFGIKSDDFYQDDSPPVYQPKLLPSPPRDDDPVLDGLLAAYKHASPYARKMAALILMIDAESDEMDFGDTKALPELRSLKKKPKKQSRAKT